MPKTLLEKRISQKKGSKGVLVPLLEDMFRYPVRFDKSDADFIHWLIMRNVDREERRSTRNAFSPSSFGSCLRQVYLHRNHEQHDIEKIRVPRIESSGYFFDGEFEHLKWQAMIRRLAMRNKDIELVGGDPDYPGFEIPVYSKRGDHGGTIDVLMLAYGVPLVVDVKGLNVMGFRQAAAGHLDPKYPVQTADYMMLLNSQRPKVVPQRIEKAILLIKSKGGPDPKHPLALTEVIVKLSDHLPGVQLRLEALRACEEEGSIPKPECKSTQTIQFGTCPFNGHCREEVKRIEARAKTANAEGLSVSRPTGDRRSRRPRPRR